MLKFDESWEGSAPASPHNSRATVKMGPFGSLGLFFSNSNSCIGGFGPFDTLGDPSPRGPPRSSPLHLWNHFSSLAIEPHDQYQPIHRVPVNGSSMIVGIGGVFGKCWWGKMFYWLDALVCEGINIST